LRPLTTDDSLTPPIKLGFSYNGGRRHPTEHYLSDAFGSEYAIHYDLQSAHADVSVIDLLEKSRGSGNVPEAFAQVIDTPPLPSDLHRCTVPTVCLDIDSFGWTSSRIRWAMLFDYVFVWHPSLLSAYKSAGHPKVFMVPQAVDATLYDMTPIVESRSLDVGWVGAFDYGHYTKRRRIIERLAAQFNMNNVMHRYSKDEIAQIYKESKIVVNVSREDFPQDANLRCYEAMAAGALLITELPSELTEWGFREGEHFVGWHNEGEISSLVDYYLRNDQERIKIAHAGREITLADFTFQKCRDTMSAILRERPAEFFAPARNWPAGRVGLLYLEHHYRHQRFEPALKQFCALGNLAGYWKGLPMILKTTRHWLKALT